jgi:D-alanyl-D-alanine endopeptidase (penicillin-binding protein 7)
MTAAMLAEITAAFLRPGGIVDALGWVLVHFLWQGALAGIVTALLLATLPAARPQLRYAIACAGLLACVLWPAVTLALRLRGGTVADGIATAVQLAGPLRVDRLAGAVQAHMNWIVATWAACCLALLARTALGMAWIARAARTGARDPHWQERLDRLAAAMGVARQVRLRSVRGLASPVTAGCWRPVVLVPASLLSGLPPDLLQALLAHEMAHIRRHDYVVNVLQNLAEILLFYHPAVWWLSRRIRFERELIADDLAAGHAGGPRRLAHALSELEKRQFAHHEPALAADGGDLMKRVIRLLRPATRRDPSTTVAAALAALLPALALAGAFFAGQAQADVVIAKPDKRAFVDFKGCAKPTWPQASLAARETGTVTLSFLIGKDGTVDDAKVKKSSGHPALDEAALEGIRKCQFVAGVRNGEPVTSWMQMQYVWTLN